MTRRSAMMLAAVSPVFARAPHQKNPKGGVMPPEMNEKSRPSPHAAQSIELNGQKTTISYGRPYLKGRHLGDAMAPFDKVWRLGADEATKITVTATTSIQGGPKMSSGSYSLFAIPRVDHWTLIVNKTADQWGAFQYDEAQDLGRVDLKVTQLATAVEQFTIALKKEGSAVARATFSWDRASVSAVLTFT